MQRKDPVHSEPLFFTDAKHVRFWGTKADLETFFLTAEERRAIKSERELSYHRQIVLDTETTGLFPEQGDRIIEIGCIEIINGKATGKTYQQYINPQRESHPEALRVHGLTAEFLADKPKFAAIAKDFLHFIQGAELIIHHAPFDVKFINAELQIIGERPLERYCHHIIDTRLLAQKVLTKNNIAERLINSRLIENEVQVKQLRSANLTSEQIIAELINNPKFRCNSLDRLCQYYGINLQVREKNHGALVDCRLLEEVYFHLAQAERQLLMNEASVTEVSNRFIP